MKVAIIHDWMTTLGGGEKVVLTLADALSADVFTTEVDWNVVRHAGFERVRVRPIASLPKTQPWRTIGATRAFSRLSLEPHDVIVLSGNWTVHAARRHHPNVYYCYTPTRIFYDLRDSWIRSLPRQRRPFARAWTLAHRWWNERAIPRIDQIVAISANVQGRIRRYWGRDSVIVHPPVPTARYRFEEVGDFWLQVSRLSHEKGLDLAMEIFRRLPGERLLIVGGTPRGTDRTEFIRALRPPDNVEFHDTVPESELGNLYARCRGVISTSVDEDFGMTAVEANASGKVVLAPKRGGYQESQVDGVTGFLLPSDARAFADRIASLAPADLEGRAGACREQARRFDVGVFVARMRARIEAAAGQGNR
ncbi:MAG TPA: glycosyltransferase [Thermoplasmata archaeon]|nr:glycosyltransferase [Thermoplasmata archaeon]